MVYYSTLNHCPVKSIKRPPPCIPDTTQSRRKTKKMKRKREMKFVMIVNSHSKKKQNISRNPPHHKLYLQTQHTHDDKNHNKLIRMMKVGAY